MVQRGDTRARGHLGQKQQVSFHKVEGTEVTGGGTQDRGQPPRVSRLPVWCSLAF